MPDGAHQEDWRPRHSPWLIAMGVMLATFMQVLDTSIANIALPHIAGSLSATTDEATWVLTSYLVANAIILPMTGWLGNHFGRKRVLISCIGMFTFASVLCGMAGNLPMLIAARILQGAGGGAMVPIAQAMMLESFPVAKRGVAMATFAMGVVVAPIIGPTLGGWITDNYSWRWIFYINLPVGMLAIFLAEWLVEDPPYIKRNEKAAIDFIGFGLLAVWLATLQIVLDKGQEADWLGADWIRWFIAGFRCLADRLHRVGIPGEASAGGSADFEKPEFRHRPDVDDGHRHHPLRHDGGTAAVSADADGLSGAAKRLRDESARRGGVLHDVFRRAGSWDASGCAGCCVLGFRCWPVVLHVERHQFAGEHGQRHLAERGQRHRHQLHFRAADHGDDEPVAPAANRQRHRPLQSHAQSRRQHRHRVRHHACSRAARRCIRRSWSGI